MSKITRKRKLKGLFYKYKIHPLPPSKKLDLLAHMGYASKWNDEHRDLGFTDFHTSEFEYAKREKLFDYLIESESLTGKIDYLEFGVAKGTSFKKWVVLNQHADSRFYGFDTSTGLPEAWGHFEKGAMSSGNKLPEIDDPRVNFYQGLFQQTLIPFLKSYSSSNRKVIHMDADIYSATLYVLTLITPFLNKGDVIMFDEFNVPLDEFKAFKEWSESFYIEYEVLGEVNNYYQVALKIK